MNEPSKTPRTDAVRQAWIDWDIEDNSKRPITHPELARAIELELNETREVMEKMFEINNVFAELCKENVGATIVAVSTSRYYARTQQALSDYHQLKEKWKQV